MPLRFPPYISGNGLGGNMNKIIVRLSLFRFGINKFEHDVNALLDKGWKLDEFGVSKVGLFRFLCIAKLSR